MHRFRQRMRAVHLKDVRNWASAPGYEWAELGRGRADLKRCVTALKEIGFAGWAVVELDQVPGGGSPKQAAVINRQDLEQQLGLTV